MPQHMCLIASMSLFGKLKMTQLILLSIHLCQCFLTTTVNACLLCIETRLPSIDESIINCTSYGGEDDCMSTTIYTLLCVEWYKHYTVWSEL